MHWIARVAVFVCVAAPSWAQESRASIVGRVTDSTGAVVPGVTVTATNKSTNVAVRVKSNEQGNYQILFINPGIYRVTTEMPGFKSFERDNIELRINDRVGLDIVIEVGDVAEKIEVTASTPLLETTTANVGTVVDNRNIAELPIPHGSVRSLFYLLNGAVLAGGSYSIAPKFQDPSRPASSSWLTFNGSPVGSTEFTLDGVPNTQTANSDFGSAISNQPPADAIQELKLETTYDASVGHTSGTHVNMIIRSGTNDLHGSAYFFYRDPAFYANTFFGNRAGQERADFNYKRGGGSFSGPIRIPGVYNGSDRTFFMYAYEIMDEATQGYAFVGTVPTMDARKGDFSWLLNLGPQYQLYDPFTTKPAPNGRFSRQPIPGNIIPASRHDPIALKAMQYWPEPNIPGRPDGTNNYALQNQPAPNRYQNHVLRLDHMLTEKHRTYARWVNYFKKEGPYRNYLRNIASGRLFNAQPYNVVLDDTYMATPNLVIDMRYGYQRFQSVSIFPSQGFDLSTLGFPQALIDQLSFRNPAAISFPSIAPSGVQPLQGEGGSNAQGDDIHSAFVDVNRPTRNHALRFGAEARIYRKNYYNFGYATPRFVFGGYTNGPLDNSPGSPGQGQGMAAFLLGQPSSGMVDRNDSYALKNSTYGIYIQDDWRVTPMLTVTMGLRYEYMGPMTERFDRTVRGFDPAAQLPIAAQALANYAANPIPEVPVSAFQVSGGVTFAGVGNQPRTLYQADKWNFMPRVGFAYNLFSNTVFRGGYGIYFLDPGIVSRFGPYQYGYSQTTPLIPTLDNGVTFRANLANPFPDGIQEPPGNGEGAMTYVGRGVSVFDTGLRNPYLQRWNLNVQHLLPGNIVFETGYAGSRSTRLRISRSIDSMPVEYLSTLPTRDQARIDRLGSQVSNPFYPLLPGTSLAARNVSVSQLLLPYPPFTSISMTSSQGYSWYHSWQTRIERRFANGFSFQLGYTFAKMMEAVTYLNAGDPMPYRTVSPNDRPHHVGISGIYELPFGKGRRLLANAPAPLRTLVDGWQVGVVMNSWSGSPLSFGDIIFSGDIKDIPLPKGQRTVERWFNIGAGFERAPAKQLAYHRFAGPLYYSGIRADGTDTWDISLMKYTNLRENLKLQIRAEAFNAFNHPNFTAPNTSVTSSAFGTVTGESTFTRQIQFGVKLLF
ncbi:MAG: TonB-dependent receptor [Bryobacteraceae bacterium]|nr:TonB-dependent receptor [Bryobacteraceae bacterium]